jgi:tetratricopeptide (TPR) repeat protein
MALRIPEGDAAVRRAIIENPQNLLPTFLANYDDCLTLMLNGDPAEFKSRRHHYEERIEWMQKGPKDSYWLPLTKGILHLQWALIYVRFGERVKAALAFRRSYVALKEGSKTAPPGSPLLAYLGFEEALVGTLPEDYKWIAGMFGLKGGGVHKGVNAIGTYLENARSIPNAPLYAEAQLFHSYLRFYLLQQQDEAWNYLNSAAFNPAENMLHRLVVANVALNFRKADAAITHLQAAATYPQSSRFPVVDYELGNALLHKLDGGCVTAYNRYLSRTPGSWYQKDAQQKIAWAYLLMGKRAEAGNALAAVHRRGNTFVDADKQAQKAAENNRLPNPLLLAPRLLCDGGFYAQALKKLAAVKQTQLPVLADRLEYYYRCGRTYDGLDQDDKALSFYRAAYEQGKEATEQFGARAALQSGILLEKNGDKREALRWYHAALDLRDHDFQASIDQQAKAGIDRLSK